MKQTITIILLLLNYVLAPGQDTLMEGLFQANSKTHLYYVNLKNAEACIYEIGRYWDKAGTGYSIRMEETLTRQSDDSYLGKTIKLIKQNNKLYLVKAFKTKKHPIDTVKNLGVFNNTLNNAYYLDEYFKMSRDLNKIYPLNHHTFRNGFHTWKEVPDKEVNFLQFRDFANKRLKKIRDSIGNLQDIRIALTNYIIQHLITLDYNTLKDSLIKLPAEYKYSSWYYGTVINEVAKQRPEYFFRLAEDLPDNRNLIYNSVENNKEIVKALKAVEGHYEIKKDFFKDRRLGQAIPHRIIGTYAVIGGLLTWLILSKN